jgi:DNA-binding protein WhiA
MEYDKDLAARQEARLLCRQAKAAQETLRSMSQSQLDAIRHLRDTDKLSTLPPGLQEIALVRLEHPDATLSELGQFLDPPIGKSGVNHRMRRLMTYIEAQQEDASHEER